jgi:hypothetical protein
MSESVRVIGDLVGASEKLGENWSKPRPDGYLHRGLSVWSTVLGASLTTVDTQGDKRNTKVFAGGAHIATQDANGTTSTGDDRILFTSADPVTGTKVMFDYTDGMSYFAREV